MPWDLQTTNFWGFKTVGFPWEYPNYLELVLPLPHNINDKFSGDIMPISNYESLKGDTVILLMVQKSGIHQLIWSISHCLQGFIHVR